MHLRDRPYPALPRRCAATSVFPARCWIESTSTWKCHGWPTTSWLTPPAASLPRRFEHASTRRGNGSSSVSPVRDWPATRIWDRRSSASSAPRFLRPARRRPSPDARSDAADAPQRAGVPPDSEGVAHDGRIFAFGFGGRGGYPDAPSGGGVAVSGAGVGICEMRVRRVFSWMIGCLSQLQGSYESTRLFSSSACASCQSRVSHPSVNQAQVSASRRRAASGFSVRQSLARLRAACSSNVCAS